MKNKFVDTLLFLEEFQLKEAREKQAFFSNLKDNLDMVPADVAKYKVLPKLIEVCNHSTIFTLKISIFHTGRVSGESFKLAYNIK